MKNQKQNDKKSETRLTASILEHQITQTVKFNLTGQYESCANVCAKATKQQIKEDVLFWLQFVEWLECLEGC